VDLGSCGICGILGEYEKSRDIEIHSHIMYLTGICSACKQEYLQNR
jgi:Fe2+ or Zn2+ uptake regulation protein